MIIVLELSAVATVFSNNNDRSVRSLNDQGVPSFFVKRRPIAFLPCLFNINLPIMSTILVKKNFSVILKT